MVEAVAEQAARAHLSNPTTARGFKCPIMMTEGNTHIIYGTETNLVFQGRNGAPDFVYQEHRQRITALGHQVGDKYAFGDQTGVVVQFKFSAEGRFEVTKTNQALAGPIKDIKFTHTSKELQAKIIVIGDGGPGGTQASANRAGNNIECGKIQGSSRALLACALTKAEEQKEKTKCYSGGETGEFFMHEGTPFPGNGQIIERFQGEYINAIAVCDATNRVYVGTSGKKIAVFSTETQEKICEVENAHAKSIYGLQVVPEGNEASIVTCSSDNLVKTWKFDADSNQLTELATIQQFEGAEEEISRQLLGLVAFIEDGALKTIAVNLQGDLVLSSNSAPAGQISGTKDKLDATCMSADGTLYYSSETFVVALRGDAKTRVSGITTNLKMDVLLATSHSVYAGSINGFIHKINGDAATATKQLEGVKILDMTSDGDSLWVLGARKDVHEVDANSLEVKRNHSFDFEGQALTFVAGQLWIGDKTGKIQVINAADFASVATIEGAHQQSVFCMATSPDSTLVASGDKYRHVKVWNAGTREQAATYGTHKNHVKDLTFTQDSQGVASVSDDQSLVVFDISTKKTFQIARIHGDKQTSGVAVAADKSVYTLGQDCQVRQWPVSETWAKIPA